jgi:hypothetical protein
VYENETSAIILQNLAHAYLSVGYQ